MRRDARERAIWVYAQHCVRAGQRYWPTEEEEAKFIETGEHSMDYLVFSRTEARRCRWPSGWRPNVVFEYRVWRTLKEAVK